MAFEVIGLQNRKALCFLFWLSGLASGLHAQTTFGTIRGRAIDTTGAGVPGVRITVRNASTGVTKALESDASGGYEAGYLQPGTYGVTAERTGFKRFESQEIPVNANSVVLAELRLQVGEVSERV